MEQHLFTLLLFTEFVPFVLSATHQYYLVQDAKTWTDARKYCQSTHTDLAVIKSNDDMVRLQNEANNHQFSSSAWIGMYSDINKWHWSYKNEPVGNWRSWEPDEPNNHWGDQNCGAISPVGWWDVACYEQWPYVCFDETKTGNARYIYIDNYVQWTDAQAYCRQYHTDLASARDQTELKLIQSLVPDSAWIGLFKDGWMWVDQTKFSYVNWMSGEPDNDMWDENCGYLDMGKAGDSQCTEIMPFFCYSGSASKKKQTVMVKIQSDENLNDPAVNEEILEKIKQKLKDHGMDEDVMLKWSLKPDGLVFHKEKRN